MKVKFTQARETRICGLVEAGQVVDLPQAAAQQFIDQGFADRLAAEKPKTTTSKED